MLKQLSRSKWAVYDPKTGQLWLLTSNRLIAECFIRNHFGQKS